MFSVVRTLTGMERHESFQCYTGRPGGPARRSRTWRRLADVWFSCLHCWGPEATARPRTWTLAPRWLTAPITIAAPTMLRGVFPGRASRGRHTCRLRWKATWVRTSCSKASTRCIWMIDGDCWDVPPARFQRQVDAEGVDDHQRRAFELLTSSRLADAIDLEREDASVRERYGQSQPTVGSFGGAPQSPQHLLLARRLVEVGVRCVTVAFGTWDWHGNREGPIDRLAKKYLPVFDHALAVFLDDLSKHTGLLERA